MKKPLMTIHPINAEGYTDAIQTHSYNYPFYIFAYIMEGESLTEVDGKNVLLTPGQLILVPENKTINLRYFKDCSGYDGCFALDFLKDASYQVLRSDEPIIQSFWFDDAVFIGSLMKRMATAYTDKDTVFLQSALDLILSQLRPRKDVDAVPEKFLQLVFSRGQSPLTVSQYAEILKVTPNYLNKTVKAHTHRTAIDWIEIARLNLAKKLLKDPSIPIVEVAERIGLPDQSYFSRFFKKEMGLTPSQYRNNPER